MLPWSADLSGQERIGPQHEPGVNRESFPQPLPAFGGRARERPVVRVQLFDDGEDFFLDKFGGRPSEEPLLLGEVFAREKILRVE